MRRALEMARDAASRGEVPVGAVVVSADGVELASAGNAVESLKDATAHAEILALRAAAQSVGDWRLDSCTLYVTKEPCAMCAGALVNCRVGALVFGVSDPRMGAAGGALSITDFPGMLHRVPVRSGVCAEECREVLQEFFRARRNSTEI
ncbi:MAG: tRNA adenosine(34) deaminase TadA [Victivallales bacterium]|nr:tRNA adenosine(34) deaminase TadA [Victivallales bacterium]